MTKIASQRVLVLDFGSQYAQLIARRVRQQQVYCEIVRHDITAERIQELAPRGLILSGGPSSVYQSGAPQCDPAIFDWACPCWASATGCSWPARPWAGRVESAPAREYGRAHCRITDDTELLAGLPAEIEVWMSHGDQVTGVSADFLPLAATDTCPFAAVRHRRLPIYGLQFHPEVTHTPQGPQILGNFLNIICHCSGTWKLGDFAARGHRRYSPPGGPATG